MTQLTVEHRTVKFPGGWKWSRIPGLKFDTKKDALRWIMTKGKDMGILPAMCRVVKR